MKDLNNLSCPNCKSSNIKAKRKKIEQELSEDSAIKTEPVVYECTCLDCHHHYEVKCGYRKYFVCANPLPINDDKSINLLVTYQSDSPLENDYKIVSVKEKEQNKDALIYLLLMKNKETPIVISKELIDEMKEEPPKIFSKQKL